MAKIHQLVRCRMKDKPGYTLMLREGDINPAVHERVPLDEVPPEEPKRAEPEAPEEPENDDGLLTLTMAKLRELPEYGRIEKPAATKAALVAQLRAVRDAPEPSEDPADEPPADDGEDDGEEDETDEDLEDEAPETPEEPENDERDPDPSAE